MGLGQREHSPTKSCFPDVKPFGLALSGAVCRTLPLIPSNSLTCTPRRAGNFRATDLRNNSSLWRIMDAGAQISKELANEANFEILNFP